MVPAAHSGDILRGGAGLPGGRTKARTASGSSGTKTAGQLQSNAKDRLARTNAALDAVKAMQKAARANSGARLKDPVTGARLPQVPDGLRAGGLKVDPRVPKNLNKPKAGENASLWVGAKLPTQTGKAGGAKNVTIVQTEQQALLSWETFNIGKKTTLTFDQSKGGRDTSKWIAFNKVRDPNGRPSQILGSIKADGQVYVINQNGIIFGGSSQVNTHGLTAAAIPINDNLVARGLLDNPTGEFLFNYQRSQNLLSTISATNPMATFNDVLDPNTVPKIEVSVRNNATVSNFTLVAGTDYTLAVGKDQRTTLTLTPAGIAKAFPTGASITTEKFSATFGALTGNILVQKGARLTSPTSAANVGGRVVLVGANVRNRGTIETPDGQTILAAGLQIGLQAHSGDDPSLRGLDPFIGVVSDPTSVAPRSAGRVINAGLIDVPRGNATLAGSRVMQDGFIESSTSVSLNGSVDLIASFDSVGNPVFVEGDATKGILFVPKSTGTVSLGKDSVIRILPEWDSDARTVGTELALSSRVGIRGKNVHLGPDSILQAPNADVAVNAGEWFYTAPTNIASPPRSEFVLTNGQIYADRGATVDVSGTTDAVAPLEENVLTLQLRGAEFADSPLQREGPFRASDANQVDVTVDLRQSGTFNGREWVGTPLADVSGFLNLIQRSVGELTKDGGTVSMNAGQSLVLREGSTVDVSGGYLTYEGGFVQTTRVTAGSQIIDIADATPDLVYDGVYSSQFTRTHSKWGVTKTYSHPFDLSGRHYESSYVSGGAGGSVSIKAPTMAIDGKLRGNTVAGPRQLRDSSGNTNLPDSSKLQLTFAGQELIDVGGALQAQRISPKPPKVIFDPAISQKTPAEFAVDDFDNPLKLDPTRRNKVVLSSDLVNFNGFSSLIIENVEGSVIVNPGVQLTAQPGGAIDFQAANIDIRGDVVAPGGDLKFTAYQISPYEVERLKKYTNPDSGPAYQNTLVLPGIQESTGRFSLRSGASLSTAGLISDERSPDGDVLERPFQAAGGSVQIAAYEAALAGGSVVDVSGGVKVSGRGDVSYGNAGSISVLAGRDPGERSLDTGAFLAGTEAIAGGRLSLAGDLRGYSGATGGSLSIRAMRVHVGSEPDNSPFTFDVTPDFFNRGGFTSFSITGIASAPSRLDPFAAGGNLSARESLREMPENRFLPGLVIESGLHVAPQVDSWLARPIGRDGLRLETTRLPEGLRTPISMSFTAAGARNYLNVNLLVRGDLEMGAGSFLDAGPGGSVSLSGDTVSVLGSVNAPGGSISVKGGSSYALRTGEIAPEARATVYIGPNVRLDASGTPVYVPDPFGRRVGTILPGGDISISGNILAEASSILDVSGTSAMFDLNPAQVGFASPVVSARSGVTQPLFSRETVPVRLDSDGGSISLAGSQMLFVDSMLEGGAGGDTALGGSLAVSSGRFYHDGEIALPTDIDLVVRQSGFTLPQVTPEKASEGSEKSTLVTADRGIGSKVFQTDGALVPARGYFAADQFANGGFDSLGLGGNVRFSGPVTIDARQSMSVADGGIIYATDAVKLSAPYVALGKAFTGPLRPEDTRLTDPLEANRPFYFSLRRSTGSLTVVADLIDIGNLAVRGVGVTNLIADGGDIRGQGTLAVAGHLNIHAGQVYPVSGGAFTLSAFDYRLAPLPKEGTPTKSQLKMHPGSITITASGTREAPLSAGGVLNIYASEIEQGGVLRAPLGTINLGWDDTGESRKSLLVGANSAIAGQPLPAELPVTSRLVLAAGSETSVSAANIAGVEDFPIPYGLLTNSDSWIDPRGIDISVGGVPSKAINLSAKRLNAKAGAIVDIRGGGDLYAYRWNSGLGGTRDILASETSFAVIPTYEANFAPYAPFSQADAAQTTFNPSYSAAAGTAAAVGYVNSNLHVGDRVRLGASSGLPEGDYTLLPARYALLPGAFLVTPQSGSAMGTLAMPDGSSVVSGFTYNALNGDRQLNGVSTRFEVASASVVRDRAEYENFYANSFFRRKAREVEAAIPQLPRDAGNLVFQAAQNLHLNSTVQSLPREGGIGARIDISTPQDILIVDRPPLVPKEDTIVLNADRLSSFGAESLLIGGVRSTTEEGKQIDVQTRSITLQNRQSALTGPEVILAAGESLILKDGAKVVQTGRMVGRADKLLIEGDGALLRVSSDPNAAFERRGVTANSTAVMTVGAGAVLSGTSLTLDSSAATSLSPQTQFQADYVALNSGQISLRLDEFGEAPVTTGLVLAGNALRDLEGVKGLSLLSYSSIDLYGSGRFAIDGKLELHAGEIHRASDGAGNVRFQAGSLVLDNQGHGRGPRSAAPTAGSLTFIADTIEIGNGRLDINQFDVVNLNAASGVRMTGRGRIFVQNDLTLRTPALTGDSSSITKITVGGRLQALTMLTEGAPSVSPGLAGNLTLQGQEIAMTSDVLFPSGVLSLIATQGDITVGGRLDVGGAGIATFDRTVYTDGGQITLNSQNGSVRISQNATVSVAAQSGGGNAGALSILTPRDELSLDGTLLGQGGNGGTSGRFFLDVRTDPRLSSLNSILDTAAFSEQRSFRVREGDVVVGGNIAAHRFDLSTDQGAIRVTGTIDASGETGGSIRLQSHGDLILESGSKLTVAGAEFSSAGKGGSILLAAGSQSNGSEGPGMLTIQSGADLDLSVAAANPSSESMGQFEGILHLRAPRNAANDDLRIASIGGTIRGASHVIVEGYKLYELTGTGLISTALRTQMKNDATAFLGAAGDPATASYTAMRDRLLAGNAGLEAIMSIRPGIELINRTGDLTLGAQGSTATNDWNLQTFRFGPQSVPGILTMRASGDLVFFNALQDGFAITNEALAYRAPLMAPNPNLPVNAQSWSFRLTSGADLFAADYGQVRSLVDLPGASGSVRLGKFVARGGISSTSGANATTLSAVTGSNSSLAGMSPNTATRYQVIRTGSGDIEVAAGRDVQLLNQFATIYTAGTLIADPTLGGTFDVPNLSTQGVPSAAGLGTPQQPFNINYPAIAQYTIGGGNVSITAGNDIAHYLRTSAGVLSEDSSRQLPTNWLYRRGYVDPATGQFATSFRGETASTTWWVDFANFFEGIGALGGGDVSLIAGRDIKNVDAVAPTNARMPKGQPSGDNLVELGGGDVLVRAGRNIDGGVYYVERGAGRLEAGGSIVTNSTRSPSGTIVTSQDPLAEQTWLPTTLFVGKGSFDLRARGDILFGPVSSPFLLASGINNGYWYKSFFSTYSPSAEVSVNSFGGSVTLRQEAGVASNTSPAEPLLYLWMREVQLYGSSVAPSALQPWLRLNETNVEALKTVVALSPPSLRVTAPSGDINIVGDLTLTPSARGTLDLSAGGSVNGLQISGYDRNFGLLTWTSSRINVSDASSQALPSESAPFSYQSQVSSLASMRASGQGYLDFINLSFNETGAVNTVLATKQALHSPGLHADDPEPLRIYAGDGNISGFTLFSPKRARILAGKDISDISFYIQNLNAEDVTTIASGRDLTPYDANSPLRSTAFSTGNIIAGDTVAQAPQAGDIQVSGPGVVEILAGRDLDLGAGATNDDGTATGITTIGNRRNPYLPFDGADIEIAAGIGPATSLLDSALDFEAFLGDVAKDERFEAFATTFLPEGTTETAFDKLSPELQSRIALRFLFKILSGTAADRNDSTSPNYLLSSAYDAGYAAIATLFGDGHRWNGDVLAQGRDIRTKNGGNIDIVVPGGDLRLANVVIGDPEIPPGIITETGGGINILTERNVDLGVGRIFTLRGGDMVIWSSTGDIAAGASSRTVASAPPVRVIIDPQSADLETDLAGLSTGGGIGALATVAGVEPSNIDLIAPVGTVDAGDAGIRASGNINIAAETVLNTSTISAAGSVSGPPAAATVAAPNVAGLTSAANTAGAANQAADSIANQARQQADTIDKPSTISVDVIGFGDESGPDSSDDSAALASPASAG